MTVDTATGIRHLESDEPPGHNLPQRAGRRLWAPMLVMALMAWPAALILGGIRAGELASANPDVVLVARLGHLVPAVTFTGFLAVFAAVSFAIARILGAFRKGGGELQAATRRRILTMRMPATAKAFLALMMMATMVLLVAIVLHVVAAASVTTWPQARIEQWAIALEALRRIGVAVHLAAITLGLGTVVTVLRFQTSRLRALPQEQPVR